MGVQTGRRGKALLLEKLRRDPEKLKPTSEKEWLEYVYDYESMMDRYAPQRLDELRGIAYGSGVKYELVLINSCYHEWRAQAPLHCPS